MHAVVVVVVVVVVGTYCCHLNGCLIWQKSIHDPPDHALLKEEKRSTFVKAYYL